MTYNNSTIKQNRQGSQSGLALTAKNRWVEILSILAPELEEAIDAHQSKNQHVPCPAHGGKDGFRLFTGASTGFNATGGGICNTCGPVRDGFLMLAWLYVQRENTNGKSFLTADVKKYPDLFRKAYFDVAYYLNHGYAANPELRNRAPRLMPVKSAEEIAAQQAVEVKRKEHLMQLAQKMWSGASSMNSLIMTYLKTRGHKEIELSEMMRLNPKTPYYADTGVTYHPAIIMPVSRIEDEKLKVVALHRIYLEEHEDGRVTKAPVSAPKKIMPWGNLEGAAIRLFKIEGDTLVVGEGVETMLSVHSMTGLPTWSCVTAWGLETLQIPTNVQTIIIAADYDISGKGQQSAEKLAARIRNEGKIAIIMSPQDFYNKAKPEHKKGVDWDDAYREDKERARLVWEPYMQADQPDINQALE